MEPPDQNNVLKNPTKAKDKPSLDEINKKIIEVKKKIQLSGKLTIFIINDPSNKIIIAYIIHNNLCNIYKFFHIK